jgi:hypothetical protein
MPISGVHMPPVVETGGATTARVGCGAVSGSPLRPGGGGGLEASRCFCRCSSALVSLMVIVAMVVVEISLNRWFN